MRASFCVRASFFCKSFSRSTILARLASSSVCPFSSLSFSSLLVFCSSVSSSAPPLRGS